MKKHVLLVEDSIPAMMIEKMLMQNLDCEVDCAATGKEALELAEKNHATYHLILMDLGLPDMDGTEVSQLIRKYENDAHVTPVPIIAVTGNEDPTQHQLCIDIGMNEVVIKPLLKEKAASLLLKYTTS